MSISRRENDYRNSRKPLILLQILQVYGYFSCKQMTGIEPASSAWEADILPMNYICNKISIAQLNSLIKEKMD